ncbi:MAG TPA: alpha/beta fold hydrolase [Holophagaceae bacterium]|nr:alpha/beta fold hydrolase [Holophagaceae bacterium]
MPESALLPADMEPTERGSLRGHAGIPLAFARWDRPDPRGRAVISHGYGEHGERYRHLAKWLYDQGWSVSSLDHAGFGRSGGIRGDADGIRPFADDFAFFLRQERARDAERAGAKPRVVDGVPMPPLPVHPQIVLAHSFGGLVAMLTLLWHADTLDGLVLSSPALGLRKGSRALQVAGYFLRWIAPHTPIRIGGNKADVCSDPVLVQRYWADPLCHKWATAAFGLALDEGFQEMLGLGSELGRPMLLLQAGDDTVVDPRASEPIWEAVPPGLLERHLLEGFKHEVFHDRRRPESQALIAAWMERLLEGWRNRRPGSATLIRSEEHS